MTCEIDDVALKERASSVKRMLRPLVTKQTVLTIDIPERSPFLTFAALTGSKVLNHYTEWRFNTAVEGISAGYYERWAPTDTRRRRYYFERGYLHLFEKSGTSRDATPKQVLALHCDPNVAANEPHAIYKRGPHVHISAAGSPLDASHFALNYSHIDEILSSFENLSNAWDESIELIKDEILPLYRPRKRGAGT